MSMVPLLVTLLLATQAQDASSHHETPGLTAPAALSGVTLESWLQQGVLPQLLGVRVAPLKLLMARPGPQGTVLLALFDESHEVVEEEALSLPFEQLPLALTQHPVVDIMEAYGLSCPVHSQLLPDRKGVGFLDESEESTSLVVMTSYGLLTLERLPPGATQDLELYFDASGTLVVAVGHVQAEPHVATFYLPQDLESLSERTLRRVILERADRLFDGLRWNKARQTAELALEVGTHEPVWARLALWSAYLQDWERANSWADRLSQSGSEQSRLLLDQLERHPVFQEARLRTQDFNDSEDYHIELPPEVQGMSLWVKWKNASDKTVAALKFSTAGTWHRAEIFAWQMAKILGLEELYPATIPYTLNPGGRTKLMAALKKKTYLMVKEKARQMFLDSKSDEPLEGALKMWVKDFQFMSRLGKVDRVLNSPLNRHIHKEGGLPDDDDWLSIDQPTRYYGPPGCRPARYFARLWYPQLAVDFVDILVMDVLSGNTDRFPGGNVFFRSPIPGAALDRCTFELGVARLFSLDNGTAFVSVNNKGRKAFYTDLKVTRFHRRTYLRLAELLRFIEEQGPPPAFLAVHGISTVSELRQFLALEDGQSRGSRYQPPFDQFLFNLKGLVKVMGQADKDPKAWFPEVPPVHLPL